MDFDISKVGKLATSAFGGRVLVGALLSILGKTTPEICYGYICDDKPLFPKITGEQWQKFSVMAKKGKMQPLTDDAVISWIEQHRIDLLSIIVNTPNGVDWLSRQVKTVNNNLGFIDTT